MLWPVRSNGDCLTYRELAKKVRDILPRLGDARPYPLVARPDLETLIKVFALLERKQPILLLHPVLPSTNAIRSSQVLKDWIIICRKIRLSSCLLPELRDWPKPADPYPRSIDCQRRGLSRQHSSESRRCLAAVDFTRTYRRLLHSDEVFDRKIGNCARAEVFSERIPAPSGG